MVLSNRWIIKQIQIFYPSIKLKHLKNAIEFARKPTDISEEKQTS